jgi:hypothetical protein
MTAQGGVNVTRTPIPECATSWIMSDASVLETRLAASVRFASEIDEIPWRHASARVWLLCGASSGA